MPGILIVLFALSSLAQDPRALVDDLGSAEVERRDQATRRLKELGAAAIPALEEGSRRPDPEIAGRAARLLRSLRVAAKLSPALLKAFPGIEDRLDGPKTWTEAFLEGARVVDGSPRYRELTGDDLAALARPAIRGASDLPRVLSAVRARDVIAASPEVIRLLKHADQSVRTEAFKTLEEGRPGTAERPPVFVIDALSDEQIDVSGSALARLDLDRHADDYRALLKDEALVVRRVALAALRGREAGAFVRDLIEALKDPGVEARVAAADLLGPLGRPDAIPALVRALSDDASAVRSAAIGALARLGGKDATAAAARLLEDSVPAVRAAAVRALEKLGARESASAIAGLLRDPDPAVWLPAFSALEALGAGREAGPRLRELLRDPDSRVRTVSARLLGLLRVTDAGPDVLKLLEDESGTARAAAAVCLAQLGRHDATDRVAGLLADADSNARAGAAEALAEFGDGASRDWARLLEDPEEHVRFSAARAVGRLGRVECAPRLIALLADDGHGVRRVAAEGLGRWRHREAIPALRPLLADSLHSVRIAAVTALCRMGEEDGADILVRTEHALGALNALRRPKEWLRMSEIPLKDDLEGTRLEVLKRATARAELTIEGAEALSAEASAWLATRHRAAARRGRETVDDVLSEYDGPAQLVLEEGRLRILSRERALAFWQEWLSQKPRK